MVQFNGAELVLEHGSLLVNTSPGLKVRVGCLIITPVNNAEWTHYDVADLHGRVTVSALKNDVNIDSRSSNPERAKQGGGSDRVTVREGDQKSREEKCGAADSKAPGPAAGKGAIMNSPLVPLDPAPFCRVPDEHSRQSASESPFVDRTAAASLR